MINCKWPESQMSGDTGWPWPIEEEGEEKEKEKDQNDCEEAKLGTERPDEESPTNPERQYLERCYASSSWCRNCGEFIDSFDRCGCDYGD